MLDTLLRAIVEQPADDALRLVYADALLQAGDLRGELIVRQCRGEQAAELVDQLTPAWHAVLGPDVRIDVFDRGLPSVIDLYLSSEGLAVLDRAPIRYLKLHHDRWSLVEASELEVDDDYEYEPDPTELARIFAADARAARLPALDLSHAAWGAPALALLLSARLPALRSLYLSDEDSTRDESVEVARAIAANDTLALTDLAFCGDSYGDVADALAILAASPRAQSLRMLSLANCGLDGPAMGVLAGSPHLAALENLELTGGSNTTNRIGDDGLLLLARSPHLARLRRLTIGHNLITDRGLAVLADPTALPALDTLACNSAAITDATIAAMVAARPFDALYLGGCSELGDAALIAIARSPYAATLTGLNLHGTSVGTAGLEALIASPIEKLAYLGIRVDEAMKARLCERFGAAALAQ